MEKHWGRTWILPMLADGHVHDYGTVRSVDLEVGINNISCRRSDTLSYRAYMLTPTVSKIICRAYRDGTGTIDHPALG
jgi:hypothetical protein